MTRKNKTATVNFGKRLFAARKARCLTQTQAAEAAGMKNQSNWNDLEHRTSAAGLTIDRARRACEAMGLDLSDFL